jgi:maltose O-acetyltransferase
MRRTVAVEESLPMTRNVSSRLWGFLANTVGASALLTGEQRIRLYLRLGIPVEGTVIGPSCYFHSDIVSIGAGTVVNHGCHFEAVAPIEVGRNCGLATAVMILTSTHDIGGREQRFGPWRPEPVRIGDGTWLGARVTVLPGVEVAEGCMVAAGAVVTQSTEADGLYAGIPARRVRDL